MKERIKKVRRELDLTQQQFADRLGIKRGAIANYELGRNNPIDSVLSLICREFNVNEEWLRTGNGEMFVPNTTEEIEQLAKKYHLSRGMQIFIEKLVNAKPEIQEALINLITETSAEINSINEMEANQPAAIDLKKLSIDDRVALYRQELEREEKAAEGSQALPKNA